MIEVPLEPHQLTDEFCDRFGIVKLFDGSRRPMRKPTRKQKLARIHQVVAWVQEGYDRYQCFAMMELHWSFKSRDRRLYYEAAEVNIVAKIDRPEVVLLAMQVARYEGIYTRSYSNKERMDALDRITSLLQLDKIDRKKLASEQDRVNHDAIRKHVAQLQYRELEAAETDLRELIAARNGHAGGAGDSVRSA